MAGHVKTVFGSAFFGAFKGWADLNDAARISFIADIEKIFRDKAAFLRGAIIHLRGEDGAQHEHEEIAAVKMVKGARQNNIAFLDIPLTDSWHLTNLLACIAYAAHWKVPGVSVVAHDGIKFHKYLNPVDAPEILDGRAIALALSGISADLPVIVYGESLPRLDSAAPQVQVNFHPVKNGDIWDFNLAQKAVRGRSQKQVSISRNMGSIPALKEKIIALQAARARV